MTQDRKAAREALTSHLAGVLQYADAEQIEKTVGLLAGEIGPDDIEATKAWVQQCFHRPSDGELMMHALNDVLDCHGVEHIHLDVAEYPEEDDPAGEPVMNTVEVNTSFDYLNTGDTYIQTIIACEGDYYVTSWGDMVEALEGEAVDEALGIDWSQEKITNPHPMPASLTAMIEAASPPDSTPAAFEPSQDLPEF